MVEFNGNLYGNPMLFFLKQVVKKLQILFVVVFTCLAPLVLLFAYKIGVLKFVWVYPFAVFMLCLFTRILLKTGNKDVLIKRVYVEGDYIYSVTHKEKYKFKIKSAKKVTDYGDFYFIAFSPFLPVPDIVCQKDLLSKGTLEEFELLFGERIVKKSVE